MAIVSTNIVNPYSDNDIDEVLSSMSIGIDLNQAASDAADAYINFGYDLYYDSDGIIVDSSDDTHLYAHLGEFSDTWGITYHGNFAPTASSWTLNALELDSEWGPTLTLSGNLAIKSNGSFSGSYNRITFDTDGNNDGEDSDHGAVIELFGNFGQLTKQNYTVTKVVYTFENYDADFDGSWDPGEDTPQEISITLEGSFKYYIDLDSWTGQLYDGTIKGITVQIDGQFLSASGLSISQGELFTGGSFGFGFSSILAGNDTLYGSGDNQVLDAGGGN